MAKKPTLHPHADKQAFERLMLLIATLVQYPGVGWRADDEPEEGHRDALQAVRLKLTEVAATYGIEFPADYPAIPTLRKDLETLRRYGLLEKRMYRWGYYLGTGAMNREELQIALAALASSAKYQANPQVRRIYETLLKRLRGLDWQGSGKFFYPIYQHLNRSIVHTDPQEMMEKGENQETLFHQLESVERAIVEGQAIEISRTKDFYSQRRVGPIQIWPLQFIYYDIAWYLIYEYCSNGHLAIGRVNRFGNYCRILASAARGTEAQQHSLQKAHKLLENGWGLNLGDLDAQSQELKGDLKFETVKVRFFPPVTAFIVEGVSRHPNQQIRLGPKDERGHLLYVDYRVPLPPRSLDEFSLWVYRYLDSAQILAPRELWEKHRQKAQALVARYDSESSGI